VRKIPLIIILSGLVVLPLFQNCGATSASSQKSLHVGNGYSSDDCLSSVVDCGPKAAFLQITLDLANPLIVPAANAFMSAYGRCNTGNYLSHKIHVVVTNSQGGLVYEDTIVGACVGGVYSIKNIDVTGAIVNENHELFIEILGVEVGEPDAGNSASNGSASIDFSKQL
jgi:hypothetical protein